MASSARTSPPAATTSSPRPAPSTRRPGGVTGHAFGGFGGELAAIAYCTRSKRPLLREVSGSTLISAGALGTASTPSCPKGRRLTAGGFSSHGSTSTYFGDGRFTRNGLWQASGYAGGGSSGFSAFGYCLKA